MTNEPGERKLMKKASELHEALLHASESTGTGVAKSGYDPVPAPVPYRTIVWGSTRTGSKTHAWLQYYGDKWRYPACGKPKAQLTYPRTLQRDACNQCLDAIERMAMAYHETKRLIARRFPEALPQTDLRRQVSAMRRDEVFEYVLSRLHDEQLVWEYSTGQGCIRKFSARRRLRDEFGVTFTLQSGNVI